MPRSTPSPRSCSASARRSSAPPATWSATPAGTGAGPCTVTVRREGDRALLTVADEGAGLPPAEAERAFERFWRGDGARGEGSGLGLAIVRSIAERHGGSVRVDGARFTIDLPASQEPVKERA